ncbi:flagellar biosynthesis protein FlhB [Desulfovibrio subterraneus]|jgi:flagellar biosynthetic protein FlhB|uniref:Flagellar biosynthetic protein FlhB n=1 Tax=Desulfovibrio subterraneus TaxID=2718620 RepID=A0A7J0BNF8_9BACT|nr:flagellar biosynthesis protein FlhB [Desulfovibrio subterraneus]WBF69238.1 flagellar biosynthesis protein FlhB [Desulfovibrio subterraneus]GFM35267.1 flagellar biosynthesis protein FlhB [Desulfovibrio subterraneus]
MPQKDPSRTERATNKHRKKARNKGNVPKSQELGKVVSVVAGMYGLYAWIGVIYDSLHKIMVRFLRESMTFSVTPESIYDLMQWLSIELAKMLLPLLIFIGFLAYLNMRLQVGKLWTTQVFKFKGMQFNIIAGLKRMFISPQTLLRLGKSLLQAVAIGFAPYLVLKAEMHNFLPLYYMDAAGLSVYMLETSHRMVLYALVPMILIAIGDLWFTRWDYEENLKMTKDEVKDERKQAEGDPKVKAEQRKKMLQVMMRRMMQDVPKADVVITNPTHIAVAIRYDALEAPAPRVLAKGADHLAEKIKEIARENGIPLRENVPLARALYKSVEVGDMIPEDLYKAVASILASLHKFKGSRRG